MTTDKYLHLATLVICSVLRPCTILKCRPRDPEIIPTEVVSWSLFGPLSVEISDKKAVPRCSHPRSLKKCPVKRNLSETQEGVVQITENI